MPYATGPNWCTYHGYLYTHAHIHACTHLQRSAALLDGGLHCGRCLTGTEDVRHILGEHLDWGLAGLSTSTCEVTKDTLAGSVTAGQGSNHGGYEHENIMAGRGTTLSTL